MTNSADISVTLGIPAYGRVQYLVEAVRSAVKQSVPAHEIIISQNAHPDAETDERVQNAITKLSAEHSSVRANRNIENCNLSSNINSIADQATGEYVAFVGDDDRFRKDFIELVLHNLDSRPDVLFGNHNIIDHQGIVQKEFTRRNSMKYFRDRLHTGVMTGADARQAAWNCSVPIFSAAIRTSVLREKRLIDDLYGADTEFFARLAEGDGTFAFINDTLTEIRYHLGNIGKPGGQYARLVEALHNIPVSASSGVLKQDLISAYTAITVKKLILEGNIQDARNFLHRFGAEVNRMVKSKVAFQRLCLAMPDRMGKVLYSSVATVIRAVSDTPQLNR
ncbi:MAG: glycosyltransferase family 2 protein [Rhodothermales bacterium]|nr:glycosyltransferase family 2 protein [Rhodothermales bacterium]